ncbi:MAG: hypothetical protein SWJ54_01515 [Cyanobacteriota bacterium]|nr:hypothetical protein [Cyanobacteriota bacterium]
MLYLQPSRVLTHVTSAVFLRNCIKSSIFLIFLILATVPLSMFALICWKVELKTTTED